MTNKNEPNNEKQIKSMQLFCCFKDMTKAYIRKRKKQMAKTIARFPERA
jgi:hypothetical protein